MRPGPAHRPLGGRGAPAGQPPRSRGRARAGRPRRGEGPVRRDRPGLAPAPRRPDRTGHRAPRRGRPGRGELGRRGRGRAGRQSGGWGASAGDGAMRLASPPTAAIAGSRLRAAVPRGKPGRTASAGWTCCRCWRWDRVPGPAERAGGRGVRGPAGRAGRARAERPADRRAGRPAGAGGRAVAGHRPGPGGGVIAPRRGVGFGRADRARRAAAAVGQPARLVAGPGVGLRAGADRPSPGRRGRTRGLAGRAGAGPARAGRRTGFARSAHASDGPPGTPDAPHWEI